MGSIDCERSTDLSSTIISFGRLKLAAVCGTQKTGGAADFLKRFQPEPEIESVGVSTAKYCSNRRNAIPVPMRTTAQIKAGLMCVKLDESNRIAASETAAQ